MLFPQARSVRLDSDSASWRVGAHLILNDVAHRKYDLLLGTQMVTKGLDLPDVSLVGVLLADQGMDLPDFRSSEKSFARLLQVAGRSGRADKPGEVIVQTYAPESPVIVDAARQDYKSFYEQEIKSREAALYPPFIRLANFVLSGTSDEDVARAIGEFRQKLAQECEKANVSIQVLGPAVCPLGMIRGQYRRHVIIKTRQMVRLVKLLASWDERESRFGLAASIKIVVDIDPDDMM
jgi:primosomal protein N' (replication factor Y)